LRRDAWYLGETVQNIGDVTPTGANITLKMNGDAIFAGTVTDSMGPLRRLGIDPASTSFTLTTSYPGQLIRMSGSGQTITVPQNVLSAGDMISIFNVSSGDMTVAQGTGVTLYNAADGTTGNRTLAAKGICTIVCTASNEFVISGTQLS